MLRGVLFELHWSDVMSVLQDEKLEQSKSVMKERNGWKQTQKLNMLGWQGFKMGHWIHLTLWPCSSDIKSDVLSSLKWPARCAELNLSGISTQSLKRLQTDLFMILDVCALTKWAWYIIYTVLNCVSTDKLTDCDPCRRKVFPYQFEGNITVLFCLFVFCFFFAISLPL